LYLAGENHIDIRYRWIAMAQQMDFDPDAIDVHFIEGRFSIPKKFDALKRLAERLGGFDFIVVDSSAAFFETDDENNNAQAGRHASNLRELTTLPGNPCVLALCHPPKNAGEDNLQPRGGGAYVAEIDGNLTATKDDRRGSKPLGWNGFPGTARYSEAGARAQLANERHLKRILRGGRVVFVWGRPDRDVPALGYLCRQNSQGRTAR
jgi:hypothetical protein